MHGLKVAIKLGARQIEIKKDSLISRQVGGTYQIKDPLMQVYHKLATTLCNNFIEFKIVHIGREENQRVDALHNLGSSIPSDQTRAIPIIHLPGVSL